MHEQLTTYKSAVETATEAMESIATAASFVHAQHHDAVEQYHLAKRQHELAIATGEPAHIAATAAVVQACYRQWEYEHASWDELIREARQTKDQLGYHVDDIISAIQSIGPPTISLQRPDATASSDHFELNFDVLNTAGTDLTAAAAHFGEVVATRELLWGEDSEHGQRLIAAIEPLFSKWGDFGKQLEQELFDFAQVLFQIVWQVTEHDLAWRDKFNQIYDLIPDPYPGLSASTLTFSGIGEMFGALEGKDVDIDVKSVMRAGGAAFNVVGGVTDGFTAYNEGYTTQSAIHVGFISTTASTAGQGAGIVLAVAGTRFPSSATIPLLAASIYFSTEAGALGVHHYKQNHGRYRPK